MVTKWSLKNKFYMLLHVLSKSAYKVSISISGSDSVVVTRLQLTENGIVTILS